MGIPSSREKAVWSEHEAIYWVVKMLEVTWLLCLIRLLIQRDLKASFFVGPYSQNVYVEMAINYNWYRLGSRPGQQAPSHPRETNLRSKSLLLVRAFSSIWCRKSPSKDSIKRSLKIIQRRQQVPVACYTTMYKLLEFSKTEQFGERGL